MTAPTQLDVERAFTRSGGINSSIEVREQKLLELLRNIVTSLSTAGAGTVTSVSVSGGTTGLTTSGGPVTGAGTITLAGTLAAANGGTGLTALGTGVATFLGTPSSANLAAALTDETGSGKAVFDTSPTLVTPNLGYAVADGYKLSAAGKLVETGTTRTLAATDNGCQIYFTNASDITLNMAGSLGAFDCQVIQEGAGKIVFTANGQTLGIAGGFTKTSGPNAMALITSRASGTFSVSGALV